MTEEEQFKDLTQLVGLLKESLTLSAGKRIVKETPFEKQLRLYESTLTSKERSYAKHHVPLFVELYKKHKSSFDNMIEDDSFLCDESCKVEIHFGKGIKAVEKVNIKLPISVCYTKAKKLHDKACCDLTGNDENDNKIYESAQYRMCEEIKYFLLVNIYHSLNESPEEYKDYLDKLDIIFNEMKPETVDEKGEVSGSSFASVFRILKNSLPALTGALGGKSDEGLKIAQTFVDKISEKAENGDMMTNFGKMIKKDGKGGLDFKETMNAFIDDIAPDIKHEMNLSTEPLPSGMSIDKKMDDAVSVFKSAIESAGDIKISDLK